jgi:tRNA(Ile)-lysidine synthase TilS/MesJ
MESVVARFKASLRLNLKIWKDDLNLICISGGSSSMSLLDLMHEALFGNTSISQRKMFFKVHILYIDEGRAVYGWSHETWQKHIEFIKETCERRYGFTYTIIPIEAIFDVDPAVVDLKAPNHEE